MSEHAPASSPGRSFRAAWIAGVRKHYPGEPKPSYVAPWDEMPEWEQLAAAAVADQVRDFVMFTSGAAAKLSREQKGRFVALCWLGQMHLRKSDKSGYLADWAEMPEWQRETDADIFEAIEEAEATRPRWS